MFCAVCNGITARSFVCPSLGGVLGTALYGLLGRPALVVLWGPASHGLLLFVRVFCLWCRGFCWLLFVALFCSVWCSGLVSLGLLSPCIVPSLFVLWCLLVQSALLVPPSRYVRLSCSVWSVVTDGLHLSLLLLPALRCSPLV